MNQVKLLEIIDQRKILTYFQPIVSVKQNVIVGFEALSKGYLLNPEDTVSPVPLFHHASKFKLSDRLDYICQKQALEKFSHVSPQDYPYILSINCDSMRVEKNFDDSGFLDKTLEELKVPPNRILIEILESEISNIELLESFVVKCRKAGHLVALDDFGKGHSNLDRIPIIKPDIIKIDRALISNIHKHFYKQEVVSALIKLSHKIGALVVAEGIESHQEAVASLELGADLLQGYYFSRPVIADEFCIEDATKTAKYVSVFFKKFMIQKLFTKITQYKSFDTIVAHLVYDFSRIQVDDFNTKMQQWINYHPQFECIFILNGQGIQISDTVCNQKRFVKNDSVLYHPAKQGTDHSSKDYYFYCMNGKDRYVTEPYISLASGNLCTTISVPFVNSSDKYYLCVDIVPF